MADYDTILHELEALLAAHAPAATRVAADSRLVDDIGLDSMQTMEMVMELEDRLDASIPLNVLPEVETVDDLARALADVLA